DHPHPTLHKQPRLQQGLGPLRLGEPLFELSYAGRGDDVALAVWTVAGFGAVDGYLPITLESCEGPVELAERQWPPVAGKQGVVFALQLVPMAGFRLEQPEKCGRHVHDGDYTPSV